MKKDIPEEHKPKITEAIGDYYAEHGELPKEVEIDGVKYKLDGNINDIPIIDF